MPELIAHELEMFALLLYPCVLLEAGNKNEFIRGSTLRTTEMIIELLYILESDKRLGFDIRKTKICRISKNSIG